MHFRAEILKSEKCGHICHIFQVRCGTLGYASNRLIFLQVICLMGRQVFITIQKINQKRLFFHSTLLLKPGKDSSLPKNYQPIFLLSHTYKLFERLILNRISPIQHLFPEQADFRPGKSTTCQIQTLLSTLRMVSRKG